jgi:hypothetical protein
MTDDEQRKYHHNANEGETRGPDERAEPHHALNVPVDGIDEAGEAMLSGEDEEGERLEDADDRAEEERTAEGREPKE